MSILGKWENILTLLCFPWDCMWTSCHFSICIHEAIQTGVIVTVNLAVRRMLQYVFYLLRANMYSSAKRDISYISYLSKPLIGGRLLTVLQYKPVSRSRMHADINPSNASEATFDRSTRLFWKLSKPCHIGIHWIALAEFSQMSTHVPGFQSFSGFFLILYWPN